MDWTLECSACGTTRAADGLPSVCDCGQPWLVRYPGRRPDPALRGRLSGRGMWRFHPWLPLAEREQPVTLGEGDTPMLPVPRLGARLGLSNLWVKDEATNPTGSFKARGLSAAITRASAAGARQFVIPTAGNAGIAAAAYSARAGRQVRVYAPATTPTRILSQITALGGDLVVMEGHIGDCGRAARSWSAETGAVDLSTLREPYRIEGKKTMGLELAEAFGWTLPDAIFYPTGGGTGLIGMWKAFGELAAAGWIPDTRARMFAVQSSGCAPIVRAFDQGLGQATAWADPWTVASGLRVPGPLGDRLILAALKASGGAALAVADEALTAAAREAAIEEGIDFSPEGGAALLAARIAAEQGLIGPAERIVVFNTGAGSLYRTSGNLPPQ